MEAGMWKPSMNHHCFCSPGWLNLPASPRDVPTYSNAVTSSWILCAEETIVFSAVSEPGRHISQRKWIVSHAKNQTPPLPLFNILEKFGNFSRKKWFKYIAVWCEMALCEFHWYSNRIYGVQDLWTPKFMASHLILSQFPEGGWIQTKCFIKERVKLWDFVPNPNGVS